MQYRCQVHIKFDEESKNEFYFNLRSYPINAEVKAEWNFEQSFIKSNKIGNRYSGNIGNIGNRSSPTILLYLFSIRKYG